MTEERVRLTVNGEALDVASAPGSRLLWVLREHLGLRGAKYGCGEGECGACTVLLDGTPRPSCRVPMAEVEGRSVLTIEGLAGPGGLHPVQSAFLAAGALQCGYCTPGMILAVVALLERDPHPDEFAVRTALQGHICRCGTYGRILRAVELASGPGPRAALPASPRPALRNREVDRPLDLTPAAERPYFDVLPDGLVAVLPPENGSRGGWGDGGAFLHLGGTGQVTAFIGKVDGGQDNRTELTQLVAEELHVAPDRVALVMGDTDLSPFDIGTFGSRSTPDAGLHLRLAAAAGRRALADLAREHLGGVDVVLDQGVARAADGSRQVPFADLVEGIRLVVTASRGDELTPPSQWRIAGTAVPRSTSAAAVTGRKAFPSDIVLTGMLEARVLPHPFLGAQIHSLDLTGAERVAGAKVVREGDLVAVVAEDGAVAARALAAIRADFGEPPAVSNSNLVSHLRANPVSAEGWGGALAEEEGDLDRALRTASTGLSATYFLPYIAHAPMEPRTALARWTGGRVTVWTGTQRPFGVRRQVAEALKLPEERVAVLVPDFGGGFGGKHTGEAAVAAAILARREGRPVRVSWSREDEFTQGYLRPAAVIDVRAAVAPDGRILAWEHRNLNSGANAIAPPYLTATRRLVFQPAASPLRQGSYRALAATANNFARECHVDELAELAGADPVAWRLDQIDDQRLRDALRRLAEILSWGAQPQGNGVGLGVAVGLEKDARIATGAEVLVDGDGRLTVRRMVSVFDCGAVVSPDNLVNQIEGAMVMGLGGALFESIEFSDGQIQNGRFSRYRVPRIGDLPKIDVELINRPGTESAGAGETPIIAVAPAIANAIHAATGRRLRSLPLAPTGHLG